MSARLRRKLSFGLPLVIVIAAGCNSDSTQSSVTRSITNQEYVLHRGSGGEPGSLDPAKAIDSFSCEILRDLYEGLAAELEDGTVTQGVAESWTVDDSGKKYRFTIRQNARWSDGTAIKANDFVSAWRHVVDPRTASPLADILRPIKFAREIIAGEMPVERLGVSADGDYSLSVSLEHAAPYFPQTLTHCATFPVKQLPNNAEAPKHSIVSNGPFIFSKWVPGAKIELIKNRFYWDQKNVHLNSVVYHLVADEESEFKQFRSGQIAITANVPLSSLQLVKRHFSSELHIAPYLGVYYLGLNLRSGPLKSSSKLRKALAMTIDRESLQKSLLPFGQQVAYGFVAPGTWGVTPQSWAWKSENKNSRLAAALTLYNAAGYSKANPLHLKFLINSNISIKNIAIAIASMWREHLGIETELIEEEYRVFLDSRKDASRWDVIRLGWAADVNDATSFLDTFRTKSENNDAGFDSTAFDEELNIAARSDDQAIRKLHLEQAERIMLEEYPVIPIYFYSSKRLISSSIQKIGNSPLNRIYSKHVKFKVTVAP